GRNVRWAHALDLAGIRMDIAEFVLVAGAATLAAFALGAVLQGLALGLLLTILTGAAVLGFVHVQAGRRRSQFADQIDDMVTLMASNMRAGHSLLQGLNHVA